MAQNGHPSHKIEFNPFLRKTALLCHPFTVSRPKSTISIRSEFDASFLRDIKENDNNNKIN